MVYVLFILPCICNPVHLNHPPLLDKPLRIKIEGPIVAIDRLFLDNERQGPKLWNMKTLFPEFPQPAAKRFAKITHDLLYGYGAEQTQRGEDMIVRNEYRGVRFRNRRSCLFLPLPIKLYFILSSLCSIQVCAVDSK
jgi:hypothetical protein